VDLAEKLKKQEYNFLNEGYLNKGLALLTVGGSFAYGTNINTENHISDFDVRGIYLNSPKEIITMKCKNKPYEDKKTDTVLYPLKQVIELLTNVNPNVIEILGTKEEHLFVITEEGKMIRDNVDLFLSQKAVNSFGGYAIAQLRRLQNALARDSYPQKEKEEHILQSVQRQMKTFKDTYQDLADGQLDLYIGESNKEEYETEIFANINISNYPLRDFKAMMNELNNIVKNYSKLNHRNSKKDELHLNKHAMHLVRLFLMGTEILEGKGVNTYRENDRELLLDIRNGKFTYPQIFEYVDELQDKFNYAEKNTVLPSKPNQKEIDELVMEINKKVLSRSNLYEF
jgi:predicted nucleotidyltransferase